jgi:sulfatase modifying factor 1
MRLLFLLPALLLTAPASAVTVDWVVVGDPGNPCFNNIPQGCRGAVDYQYQISEVETTNSQYAEFLNSIAATDTYLVYNSLMGSSALGGIVRTGAPGSYGYDVKPGFGSDPVNYVSYHSALRFVNWLENGQSVGVQDTTTTEAGSYTFFDRTTVGSRNSTSSIVLTNDDEWIKAAYYDAISMSYNQFPTVGGIRCSSPSPDPIAANCSSTAPVEVGSYTNAFSPYGTLDQAGNLREWNEPVDGTTIYTRGGSYAEGLNSTSIFSRAQHGNGNVVGSFIGFRVAMIPEPSTGLLLAAGLLILSSARRHRVLRRPTSNRDRKPT